MKRSELDQFGTAVLQVFRSHHKNDRVTLPLLKFLDQLLTSGFMDPIMEDEADAFALDVVNEVKAEIAKSGDPNKLMLSCDVLCALLQATNRTAVEKSLVQLSIMLCHKFPRIRKVTAAKLFEAFLTYSDREIVPDDKMDEVNNILSDTDWDQPVEVLRPIRNSLCDILSIPAPALIKKLPQ